MSNCQSMQPDDISSTHCEAEIVDCMTCHLPVAFFCWSEFFLACLLIMISVWVSSVNPPWYSLLIHRQMPSGENPIDSRNYKAAPIWTVDSNGIWATSCTVYHARAILRFYLLYINDDAPGQIIVFFLLSCMRNEYENNIIGDEIHARGN